MKHLSNNTEKFPKLFQRIVAFVMTAALIGVGLMFSAVVLAFILVAGALAGAYLWWKTRHMRKQMRDFAAQAQSQTQPQARTEDVPEGDVIEGEVIHSEAFRDGR